MRKILLILMLLSISVQMMARLTLAAIAYLEDDKSSECFYYQHKSAFRRALLEVNGKEWFMKHIIYANPDSSRFVLDFIAGDYCIGEDVFAFPERREEFFAGVKKALDYLSEKNDTLFYGLPLSKSEFNSDYIFLRSQKIFQTFDTIPNNIYDFNNFYKLKRVGVDYIRMRFIDLSFRGELWAGEGYLKHYYKSLSENFINKYKVFPIPDFAKDDTRMEKYNIIENPEDAETLFEIINAFDEYVLSIPTPQPSIIKEMNPFGYSSEHPTRLILHVKRNNSKE